MTLWTLGTVMSNTTQMMGNRSDIAQSTASFWANVGAQEVFEAAFHQGLETSHITSTITDGASLLSKPADFYELINLSDLSLAQPALLRGTYVDQIDSASTESGRPTRFIEYTNHIQLWPTPDSTYSIMMRYRARQSIMTATTATPSFDTRFGLAWAYKTTELLSDAVLDHERAAMYRNKYLSELASTPNDFALRQRSAREGARLSMLTQDVTRFLDFDYRDVE